ncbi:DUF305 domain-containing protein [Streptomyces sp. NPDC052693]|uniref:DUF305 domain-containing protein n=1 Tax=Streptomyces sp. NPDC052693 TaxID=3155814 RepID=UPI00341B8D32
MTAFTRALRRTPARHAATVTAVAAGALLLAACGSGDDTGTTHHGGASATAGARPGTGSGDPAGAFNDADVRFAQLMIPHHEQALEMSRLAEGRASDAEIKELARRIERAQDPEIKAMKGWLTSWGEPTGAPSMPGPDHGTGHGDGHGDGMVSEADMDRLADLKGTAFDKAFARLMIAHHEGAIAMAEVERREGADPEARKTARAIVKGQSAEVEQLRDILGRL